MSWTARVIFGFVLTCMLRGSLARAEPGDVRTWTSASGASIEAAFVRIENGQAVLRKPDGSQVMIGMSSLAPDDRKLAQELGAPKRTAALTAEGTRLRANSGGAASPLAGRYTGTYDWGGKEHAVTCVLKGADDGELAADFSAEYDGQDRKYRGTLGRDKGGMTYSGVFDVRKPREFRLRGTFSGAGFRGDCLLIGDDGKERREGGIELKKKD